MITAIFNSKFLPIRRCDLVVFLLTVLFLQGGCVSHKSFLVTPSASAPISNVTYTKRTRNTWNFVKNKSFPIFEWCGNGLFHVISEKAEMDKDPGNAGLAGLICLAILPIDLALVPFQFLGDVAVSYESKDSIYLDINGQILGLDENSLRVMRDKDIQVQAFSKSYWGMMDAQGKFSFHNIVLVPSYNYPDIAGSHCPV